MDEGVVPVEDQLNVEKNVLASDRVEGSNPKSNLAS